MGSDIQQTGQFPLLGKRYAEAGYGYTLTPRQQAVRDSILAADHESHWEDVDCACGAKDDQVISRVDRYGLPYLKVICKGCGLLRVKHRWTQDRYNHFYAHEYRDLYNPIEIEKSTRIVQVASSSPAKDLANWIMSSVQHYGGPNATPTIVEIGAGGGWNLAGLPTSWKRIGYDVDAEYLQGGRDQLGLDMRHGFLDGALAAVAEADVVLLSHVVEHFLDPAAELAKIAAALRPGGLLLIEVPGVYRIHRGNADPMRYMQGAHTFTFSAQTLSSAVRMAGFEIAYADEMVRLVARRSDTGASQQPTWGQDPAHAAGIVDYLLKCERIHGAVLKLRSLPGGRIPAALMRRIGAAYLERRYGHS
ncbi:class I SAM-dependent methyltransferase [Niveispirillum irakense]|uniref:class I SAM-dependent methyltransferase n=1 Tax=Niveispirillum irakense TaxID=34011 RepID=UPI0004258374|nr:class I SAM-dependent methyltransferase [Niveispirillum irakense]